jgi:hypothetical protein
MLLEQMLKNKADFVPSVEQLLLPEFEEPKWCAVPSRKVIHSPDVLSGTL